MGAVVTPTTVFSVRVPVEWLPLIEEARGEVDRNSWVKGLIERGITQREVVVQLQPSAEDMPRATVPAAAFVEPLSVLQGRLEGKEGATQGVTPAQVESVRSSKEERLAKAKAALGDKLVDPAELKASGPSVADGKPTYHVELLQVAGRWRATIVETGETLGAASRRDVLASVREALNGLGEVYELVVR